MPVDKLEQLAALVVAAALVAANLLLFSPWRTGADDLHQAPSVSTPR